MYRVEIALEAERLPIQRELTWRRGLIGPAAYRRVTRTRSSASLKAIKSYLSQGFLGNLQTRWLKLARASAREALDLCNHGPNEPRTTLFRQLTEIY